jgi:hypothetical protein
LENKTEIINFEEIKTFWVKFGIKSNIHSLFENKEPNKIKTNLGVLNLQTIKDKCTKPYKSKSWGDDCYKTDGFLEVKCIENNKIYECEYHEEGEYKDDMQMEDYLTFNLKNESK